MRFYTWTNQYLSSLQVGLQSAHCLAEIYENCRDQHEKSLQLQDWAENHKTMILLNGGYSENLRRIIKFMCNSKNAYPWGFFNEGQDALDGALTCVGIVLPGVIYNGAAAIQMTSLEEVEHGAYHNGAQLPEGLKPDFWKWLTKWERELILELTKCGLAS